MGVEHPKEEILSTLHHYSSSNPNTNQDEDKTMTSAMLEHSIPLELYSLAFDSASPSSNNNNSSHNLSSHHHHHHSRSFRKWKKTSSSSLTSSSSSSFTTTNKRKSLLRPSSYFHRSHHTHSNNQQHELYRLLLLSDYPSVTKHLQKHPKDITKSRVAPLYNVVRKVLPVHLACAVRAPLDVVKLCLGGDAGSDVNVKDKREELLMTPVLNLHLVQQHHDEPTPPPPPPQATAIQNQEEKEKETIEIDETSDGWLPLHLAVYFHSPPAVIDYLLSIAPQAAKCKNGGGYLPIHFLCAHLSSSSSSLEEEKEEEKVQYQQLSVLHSLLRAFPDSIHVPSTPPSPYPHETPLQLVKRCYPNSSSSLSSTSTKSTKEQMMKLLNVNGLPPPPPLLAPSKGSKVIEIAVPTTTSSKEEEGGGGEQIMGEETSSIHSYHSTGSRSSQRTGKASVQSFTTVPSKKMHRPLQSSSMSASHLDASSSLSSLTSSSSTKKKRHKSIFRSLPIPHRHHSTTSSITSSNTTSSSTSFRHKKELDPNKPTKLYTHISNRDWKAASARLHKCPHEACVWTLFDTNNTISTLPPTMEEEGDENEDDSAHHHNYNDNDDDHNNKEDYGCHRLPLHKACTSRPPLPFLQSLHQAYPDAIRSKEKYGMLPLHVACQSGASHAVITYLLSQHKEAASTQDNFGLTPLHLACTEGAMVAVVVELVRAYPEGLGVKDERGRMPVDYVRESMHPNRKVLLGVLEKTDVLYWTAPRIRSGKKDVNDNDENEAKDVIPELYTMVQNKQWEKITSYLNQEDDDVQEEFHNNDNASSPIPNNHSTKESRHHETKVWVLDESYDTMIPRLPIHVAVANRAPTHIVSKLLSIHPSSISAKEKHDQIPLHVACSIGSVDLVSLLLDSWSEGAKRQDSYGLLPIHVACTEGASVRIVELLLKAYPESSHVGDNRGNTPISFAEASFHPGRKDVLEVLKKDVSFWIEDKKEEDGDDNQEEGVDDDDKKDDEPKGEEGEEEKDEVAKKDSVHWLIDNKEWDLIPKRLEEYPEEARDLINVPSNHSENGKNEEEEEEEEDKDKQLPLHRICTLRPKRYLIRSLLNVYPEATQIKTTKTQELPLHLAVRNDAWAQVVELLIESNPKSVLELDSKGRSALHGACIAGASVSVVKTLLDASAALSDDGDDDDVDDNDGNDDGDDEATTTKKKKMDIIQVKDVDGLTPIDYVEQSSDPHKSSLLSLLDEYGKKNDNHHDDDDDNAFMEKQKDSSTTIATATTTTTE